jgi:hypothetical protein
VYLPLSQQRDQDSHLLRQQSDHLADNLQKKTVRITYLNDISQLLMLENRTNILIHI